MHTNTHTHTQITRQNTCVSVFVLLKESGSVWVAYCVCVQVDAGAQCLNNLAETSSIMKGPPEGCVSPPAVPVLRRAQASRKRLTQTPAS